MQYLATVMYEFSANLTAVRYSTDGALSDAVQIQYYFQNTDGTEPDFNSSATSYIEYGYNTSIPPGIFYGLYTGMTPERYKLGDGNWVTISSNSERFNLTETTKVYFTRNLQTITFVDSKKTTTEFGTKTVLYGAATTPISDPESPYPGYSFTGWYYDAECTTRVDFTKPLDADLIVYAGWDTIWYKIVINPNYGWLNNGSGTGSTWFWEPYNGDPIEEYTWVKRDYVEAANGTYFYHYDSRSEHGWGNEWTSAEDADTQRYAYYTTNQGEATDHTKVFKYAENAYRYAGWYEVDPTTGEEKLYNFGEPVTHDTYLILHWKKIGTYHVQYNTVVTQDGQTISGTVDGGDSNETLFAELDGDHYADNAEVVVSRTANAPEGYNFVGWKIRGDDSGTVYYPGQSFVLLSRYTVTMPAGETIFLDAVYTRVGTAKIIYNANGGTIDPTALDYGCPTDAAAPLPTTSYDVAEGTATIENLVNNS